MNSTKQFLAWLVVLTCIAASTATATTPKLQESVRINSLELIGDPTTGANVELKVTYTSRVNGEARLVFSFSGFIKPVGMLPAETRREESMTLFAGQIAERWISLKVLESGASHISVSISLVEPMVGYTRAHGKYLNVESTQETFAIFDDRSPAATKAITPHFGSDNPLKGEGPMGLTTLYSVSITGKIEFDDPNQIPVKALYGNTVQLWFRNTANPNTWYHPVYSPDCFGILNTHYDILDVDGNYSFNFTFNGDLSGYNQVLGIVSRDNSAIRMPVQPDGILQYCNPLPTVWFSLSEAVQQQIDGSNPNITLTNANALVNGPDGAIFRNLMFAREFVFQRYQGSLPFSMQQIYTERMDIPGNIAGQFISQGSGTLPRIEIDNFATELTTTTHEFGHFVNYKMWNDALVGSQELKEGWAVFYCMASKNYANKTYGDDLRYWDDEGEVSPFTTSPRFAYIRYTYSNPGISAFACYLWNLYDNSYDSSLESFFYNGDNDDINNQEMNVFETYRTNSIFIYDPATYHLFFKTYLPTDIAQSVDKIYDFMQNPSSLMRPVQLSNVGLSTISPQQIQFGWATHHYNVGSDPFLQPGTNPPDQYRLYKSESGTWNLVQTAPFGSASATVSSSDPRGEYRITAHNASGDSYNSPVVTVLGMTLAAAQYIEPGSGGTYEVNGVPVGSSWLGYALQGQQMTLEAVPPSGWIFVQWSDGNGTNPRSLSPTDHTSIHAIFKIPLASSSSSVTAPSTQRKIIRDPSGYYHMAYESGNNIFYTKSTNTAGTSWGGEVLLSEDGYTNRSPSLSVQDDLVVVVWERYGEYIGYNVNEHAVMARTVNIASGQLGGVETVQYEYHDPALTYQTLPVAATYVNGSTRYTLAVWYDGSSTALKASVRNGSSGIWTSPTTLRTVVPAYFSVAPISKSTDLNWKCVWVESGSLYYAPISIGTTPSLGTSFQVATGGGEIEIHAPSVAAVSTYGISNTAVCWQEYNSEFEQRVVKYREQGKNGIWSTTTMVWSDPYSGTSRYYTPTLSTHPTSNNVSIVWRTGTAALRYVQRVGSVWTAQVGLGGGVDPMLSIGYTYTGSELVLARGTSTPYPLQFTGITYGQQASITDEMLNGMEGPEGRGGTVSLPEGTIGLALESAALDDTPIAFVAVNDTVAITKLDQFAGALTSEPFVPTGRLRLAFRYRASERIPARAAFHVALINESTGNVVRRLRAFTGTRDSLVTLDCQLDEAVRHARLAVRPVGIESGAVYEVERWNLFTGSSSLDAPAKGNAATAPEVHAAIPTVFALHQNYPNPFNPSTQVNFDLPDRSQVSLVIYDVLGRKVTELVNGVKDAGYHSAIWNAIEQASGVYFARFTVTDGAGMLKLSKVNKLVLTK